MRSLVTLAMFAAVMAKDALGHDPGSAEGIAFFESKIRPLLVEHCYQCHLAEAEAAKKLPGGLSSKGSASCKSMPAACSRGTRMETMPRGTAGSPPRSIARSRLFFRISRCEACSRTPWSSDTLVVWGGEFGRTPATEGQDGRDHNHYGFTMWLAGGGVKGGHVHGAADAFGFRAVEHRVHVHDFHAMLLHLMGLDHDRLTYHYSGRDHRRTDVHGQVVWHILA